MFSLFTFPVPLFSDRNSKMIRIINTRLANGVFLCVSDSLHMLHSELSETAHLAIFPISFPFNLNDFQVIFIEIWKFFEFALLVNFVHYI